MRRLWLLALTVLWTLSCARDFNHCRWCEPVLLIISPGNNTNNGYYYNPATNQFAFFTFSAGIFQLGANVIRYRSVPGRAV